MFFIFLKFKYPDFFTDSTGVDLIESAIRFFIGIGLSEWPVPCWTDWTNQLGSVFKTNAPHPPASEEVQFGHPWFQRDRDIGSMFRYTVYNLTLDVWTIAIRLIICIYMCECILKMEYTSTPAWITHLKILSKIGEKKHNTLECRKNIWLIRWNYYRLDP